MRRRFVGPERTGMAYGPEDLLFMATIGEQAAGSIATAHMSESLARTREFDAFNRLTDAGGAGRLPSS